MSPRTAVRLLVVQTVLMVGLAWAVVYLGRDEYRLAVGRVDDDLPAGSQVFADDDGGLPEVRLSAAAQRQVGLEVMQPEPAEFAPETAWTLTVVDPQPLVEWRGRLVAARQAVAQAAAAMQASEAERRRVQALFDDDRNASQRSLEQARAQAAADAAVWRGAQAQLAALRDGARAAWGPALTGGLLPEDGDAAVVTTAAGRARPSADRLAALAAGREVLLRAVLRGDEAGTVPARLQVRRPGQDDPVAAQLLGPVPAPAGTDPALAGRHLLYLAPGKGLAVGMRVAARHRGGSAESGMTVPAGAVIWHAGQPWVYVRESAAGAEAPASAASAASAPGGAADRFQRRAVPGARRDGDRWFIPGLDEDDPVVTRGAQVLLSEELKFQIKNENDD